MHNVTRTNHDVSDGQCPPLVGVEKRTRLCTANRTPFVRKILTQQQLGKVNMEHQLDATVTVLLISKINSTCFGQTFAHLQERKPEIFFYNIWYNVLLMW
jgi:hypothetical protein